MGRVHSLQSLGAVDGPGIRYVVFLQGCSLRCVYCHNPDTWKYYGAEEMTAKALAKKVLRARPYFKGGGGITVSGGEPLMQAEFLTELFIILKDKGVHTALDTSCTRVDSAVKRLLKYTDLVLADLKFNTQGEYEKYCRGSLALVEEFLKLTQQMKIPIWVRHVVVPGLNDNLQDLKKIKEKAEKYSNLQKIEWLPFHNLGLEKYESLGIPFPLPDTPNMSKEALKGMISKL